METTIATPSMTARHPRHWRVTKDAPDGFGRTFSTDPRSYWFAISDDGRNYIVRPTASSAHAAAKREMEREQRRYEDDLDDGRPDPCPGFYSPQATAWIACGEPKPAEAEYCDGCTRAIEREVNLEYEMNFLDQWGPAAHA